GRRYHLVLAEEGSPMSVGGVSKGDVSRPEDESDPAAQAPDAAAQVVRGSAPAMTPLQAHVAFFDTNNDGKITPAETRDGLARLGMSGAPQLLAGTSINATLGPKTS